MEIILGWLVFCGIVCGLFQLFVFGPNDKKYPPYKDNGDSSRSSSFYGEHDGGGYSGGCGHGGCGCGYH